MQQALLASLFRPDGGDMTIHVDAGDKVMYTLEIVDDADIDELIEAERLVKGLLYTEEMEEEVDRDFLGLLKYKLHLLQERMALEMGIEEGEEDYAIGD